MIHQTFDADPGWIPDPGHTLTKIGKWFVDWSGTLPTAAEVQAMRSPTPAQLQTARREAAKALMAHPDSIILRAIVSTLWDSIPALKAAFPNLAAFRAAIAGKIDGGGGDA